MNDFTPCTQQMIADHAGVSRSTVSLALRNDLSIPEETRRRVLAAAEDLNYRPNPMIAALMSHLRKGKNQQRYDHIALLQQNNNPLAIQLTYIEWIRGVHARAKLLGYQITDLGFDPSPKSGPILERILKARGIAGIIFAPMPSPSLEFSIHWEHFAAGSILALRQPRMHSSCNNHAQILSDCIVELEKLSYERIGLYIDRGNDQLMNHSWLGFDLAYQFNQPARHRVEPFLTPSGEDQRAPFLAWVKKHRPEVIMTIELKVLSWLQEAGYRIPEDIGIALLDRHEANTSYSGMDQQHHLVGAAAVDLISAQLIRNERGLPESPKIVNLPGRWVSGATTKPGKSGTASSI